MSKALNLTFGGVALAGLTALSTWGLGALTDEPPKVLTPTEARAADHLKEHANQEIARLEESARCALDAYKKGQPISVCFDHN